MPDFVVQSIQFDSLSGNVENPSTDIGELWFDGSIPSFKYSPQSGVVSTVATREFVIDASGAIIAQIQNSGGVTYAQLIQTSGDLSSRLIQSGQILTGNLIQSGQILRSVDNLLNTADQTLSGNLIQSGQILTASDNLLNTAINTQSGNLIQSGQILIASDNLLNIAINTQSGNLIQSGQILTSFHNLQNTALATMSGNLIQSGQILRSVDNLLNIADQTLSGNLIRSGQILNAQIIASGNLLTTKNGTVVVVPIGHGGTGQYTQTAAFDALAPTTTSGDIIVYNGTDNVRLGIGASGSVLIANPNTNSGVQWRLRDVDIQTKYSSGSTSTTSTSFIDLAGCHIATSGSLEKNYLINFTGTGGSGKNNATVNIQFVVDNVAVSGSLSTIKMAAPSGQGVLSSTITQRIRPGKIVKVQWWTGSSGTGTIRNWMLSLFGTTIE